MMMMTSRQPDDAADRELEVEGDGFEDEDVDDKEILHDKLPLQDVDDEVVIFDDNNLGAGFGEWFEEIPLYGIILPIDEVSPVSSSDEGF